MELETLELKIARSENLPVLPQIVSAVLRIADDPNASPKSLEAIVEKDPAITAKILRVAGSSYYGVQQVPNVGRAISILGINAMRSLVIGVAYQQIISSKQSSLLFNRLEFWRHSLAVATCSRILAKLKLPLKSEELYCAGLVHDVGILAMDRFCPQELDQSIRMAQSDSLPLATAQQILYGFDHTEIGAVLARRWCLSDLMRSGIQHHLRPDCDEQFGTTTRLVTLANHLANLAMMRNNSPVPDRIDFEAVLEAVGLSSEQCDVIQQVLAAEVAKVESAFQIG